MLLGVVVDLRSAAVKEADALVVLESNSTQIIAAELTRYDHICIPPITVCFDFDCFVARSDILVKTLSERRDHICLKASPKQRGGSLLPSPYTNPSNDTNPSNRRMGQVEDAV
jgi:hypothetical protein